MGTATLGDFILVMGKDQILSATMNINGFAKMLFNHGRAFNMPTRTTLAPWTFPARFTA